MAVKKRGRRRVALIAHDNKKADMLAWAKAHRRELAKCELWATHTTGTLLAEGAGLTVRRCKSGPLGGDLQIGAKIAEGEIDALVFLWDPLSPHPHDPDVKALLRVAVVYDIPLACNVTTASALIRSL